MERTISGGCLCGAVRYQGSAEPAFVAFCHCRDCQKASGGPYSANVAVPAGSVSVTGPVKQHCASGERPLVRNFCSGCGAQIMIEGGSLTGLRLIQAGTLDDPSWVEPSVHIFCASAQPWDRLPDDSVCLPGAPPAAGS